MRKLFCLGKAGNQGMTKALSKTVIAQYRLVSGV